jgi:hypothetical protein
MIRNLLISLLGIIILLIGLIIDFPFEFSNQSTDRIVTIMVGIIIMTIIYFVFKNVLKVKNKVIKISALLIIIAQTIIYGWIVLFTFIIISSHTYPMWVDTNIYTNQKHETVISEFRETSGSIFDYRTRKVIYDSQTGFRISIDWNKSRMKGTWTCHRLGFHNSFISKSDTIYMTEFKNGQEIKINVP